MSNQYFIENFLLNELKNRKAINLMKKALIFGVTGSRLSVFI